MNDKEIDNLINKALGEEQEIPEGLSERLEMYIDALDEDERKGKEQKLFIRRTITWISSLAAAFILGMALFSPTENKQSTVMADTFNDPEEAAIVAQQALAFMSSQLNKGLDPLADAGKEVKKVNEIINKTFND